MPSKENVEIRRFLPVTIGPYNSFAIINVTQNELSPFYHSHVYFVQCATTLDGF